MYCCLILQWYQKRKDLDLLITGILFRHQNWKKLALLHMGILFWYKKRKHLVLLFRKFCCGTGKGKIQLYYSGKFCYGTTEEKNLKMVDPYYASFRSTCVIALLSNTPSCPLLQFTPCWAILQNMMRGALALLVVHFYAMTSSSVICNFDFACNFWLQLKLEGFRYATSLDYRILSHYIMSCIMEIMYHDITMGQI